jgi:hypothetical protein
MSQKESGEWRMEHFSVPQKARECDHTFLRKLVKGGMPKYFCDDCEWVYVLPQAFAQPRQHIVPSALMEIAWVMKYDGPEAVAMGIMRPHTRLDKADHPKLPPIDIIREQRAQWEEVLHILDQAQENGYREVLGEGSNGASERSPVAEGSSY